MVSWHITVAASVLAAAAAVAQRPAQAHAFLDRAYPAVGSTLPQAPAAVTMWFSQSLEPAFSTATVTDRGGNRVDKGDARIDPKNPSELVVSLKPLPPGTYSVAWHVLSVDTHTTDGHFSFDVGSR